MKVKKLHANIPYKLVCVEWTDSHSSGPGWSTPEQLKKAGTRTVLCISVGWLISKSGPDAVICPHLSDVNDSGFGAGCGDIAIPKKAIVRMTAIPNDF